MLGARRYRPVLSSEFAARRQPFGHREKWCIETLIATQVLFPVQLEFVSANSLANMRQIDDGNAFERNIVSNMVVVKVRWHEGNWQVSQRCRNRSNITDTCSRNKQNCPF